MIYVIRHGQTNLNLERKMQGRTGLPLNEYGLEQARGIREKLKHIDFDLVLSSPQIRAIQTAEIVTEKKAKSDERLNVFDLGEADRVPLNELKMDGVLPDPTVYKGIEDPNSFVQRIFEFMSELEHNYSDHELNILVSGHRCTTGCIGAYFEGIPTDGNIMRYSSDTGDYKTYTFKRNPNQYR